MSRTLLLLAGILLLACCLGGLYLLWSNDEPKQKKLRSSFTTTELILMAMILSSGVLIYFNHWIIGLIVFGLTIALGVYSEYTIPADPPSIGVPVLLGRRGNRVVRERIAFVASPLETLIEVDVTLKNHDRLYEGVRCSDLPDNAPITDNLDAKIAKVRRSGGSVKVTVGTTFEPDTSASARINQYINAGMEERVTNILSDIIGETIREVIAGMSWEEASLSRELLSVLIIGRVVGAQPTELVARDAERNPIRNPEDPDTPRYQIAGTINPATAIEDLDKPELEHFLDSILRNGPSDVRGLGIRIRRINVIEVQPEGKLADDAELNAREKQQRSAEYTDFETERKLIKEYLRDAGVQDNDSGYWEKYQKAAEWVRVNRKRAQEHIVRSDNPLAGAASLFGDNMRGGKPSNEN